MLKASDITSAIQTALENDSTLSGLVKTITRSEGLNDSLIYTPWIGIYKTEVRYDPRTLGRNPTQWEGFVTVRLIIQVGSLLSGADAEDSLEEVVQQVLNVLTNDHTLQSQVDILTQATISYLSAPENPEGQYEQAADITLNWEVSTS